jgi:3-isopropylmalate/(R)-2-methylmalate dehydratase large subunit
MAKPKLRQVRWTARSPRRLRQGRDPAIINQLGVKGGVGYAYEYAGDRHRPHDHGGAPHRLQHVHRGGARFGYVNPDATTIDYLRGRPYAPRRGLRPRGHVVEVGATEPGESSTT